MKISTKGRYALRVMIDLAQHDRGSYISIKDISVRQGIPIKYLEQIVATLGKAGMLKSMRGNNGGHRLARDPEDYKVGDILRAMEGDLTPVECTADENACPKAAGCSTRAFWQGLDQVINEYVNRYSLQDLAAMSREDGSYDYSI